MVDHEIFEHRMVRLLARKSPKRSPPISMMAAWPNTLGEEPVDAIGKAVKVSRDGKDESYVIESVGDDGRLFLRPA